jgi:hypothetical protein
MRQIHRVLAWLFFAVFPFSAVAAASAACGLYVLKKSHDGVTIERVPLADGEERVLNDSDIITFVLPLSPGQSGDLIQQSRPRGTITARCRNNALKVTVRMPDGQVRDMPEQPLEQLQQYDVRVNVVGGDGSRNVFVIEAYASNAEGEGPVIDMFGGIVPMEPGDYSVTLEVSKREDTEFLTGSVPFLVAEELFITDVTLPGGETGRFIIDFGAGTTVFSK